MKSWFSAVWVVVVVGLMIGGCGDTKPSKLCVALIYSADTNAQTKLCGCCSSQLGGLDRRATYLIKLHEEIFGVATGPDDPDGAGTVPDDQNSLNEETSNDGSSSDAPEQPVKVEDPFTPTDFILVDCGNFSDASTDTYFIQSVYTAKVMEQMRYDAVNIGRREAWLTQEKLVDLLAPFKDVPVISANVQYVGPAEGPNMSGELNQTIQPFTRVEIDGHSVFFTGVTSAEKKAHDLDEKLGLVIEPPADALEAAVANAGPDDVVVAIVSDLSDQETNDVIGIQRVDMFLGFPSVIYAKKTEAGQAREDLLAFKRPMNRGRSLGRLDMELGGGSEFAVVSNRFDELFVSMDQHPMIVGMLEDMRLEINAAQKRIYSEYKSIDPDTVVDYLGYAACKECHSEIVKKLAGSRHNQAIKSLGEVNEAGNGMCLPCHTTGFGEPSGYNSITSRKELHNVTCEACHGPSEVHVQMMRGLELTGPLDGLNGLGFLEVTPETCTQCHNETTDTGFDYSQKIGLIKHWSN